MDGRKGLAKHGPFNIIHVGASIGDDTTKEFQKKMNNERRKETEFGN